MHWIAAAILIGLMSPLLFGDDETRRAQVNAATTEAFDSLRREIRAFPLGTDLTLGRLFDQAGAPDQLDATIQSAEKIGGTRWLDDQTVQVRLEIGGSEIVKSVERVAEKNPKALPVSIHVLRDRLKREVSRRSFSATGTSTTGRAADRLRPGAAQAAWRGVSDADRRAAVDAAEASAIDRVIDSLRTVEWDYGKRHLADVLAVAPVRDALHEWLAARPITTVEFRDDLEVRVALAASADDLWPVLQQCFIKQAAVSVPHDQKEWDALHRQVTNRMLPAVGTALARKSAAPAATSATPMPSQPPPWTQEVADAEGTSIPVGGSKLKTARAAEVVALARLRGRVNALPFTQSITLGDVARKDPRIEQAITRGLDHAKISKVDYDSPAPGSVHVVMTVDLQTVWRELAK